VTFTATAATPLAGTPPRPATWMVRTTGPTSGPPPAAAPSTVAGARAGVGETSRGERGERAALGEPAQHVHQQVLGAGVVVEADAATTAGPHDGHPGDGGAGHHRQVAGVGSRCARGVDRHERAHRRADDGDVHGHGSDAGDGHAAATQHQHVSGGRGWLQTGTRARAVDRGSTWPGVQQPCWSEADELGQCGGGHGLGRRHQHQGQCEGDDQHCPPLPACVHSARASCCHAR
jgi:hypothetical protein